MKLRASSEAQHRLSRRSRGALSLNGPGAGHAARHRDNHFLFIYDNLYTTVSHAHFPRKAISKMPHLTEIGCRLERELYQLLVVASDQPRIAAKMGRRELRPTRSYREEARHFSRRRAARGINHENRRIANIGIGAHEPPRRAKSRSMFWRRPIRSHRIVASDMENTR
jgi:hypothetical protein